MEQQPSKQKNKKKRRRRTKNMNTTCKNSGEDPHKEMYSELNTKVQNSESKKKQDSCENDSERGLMKTQKICPMIQTMPPEVANAPVLWKYWAQRYSLFWKFDEGIQLDHESWFSVTHEAIAKHIAERCRCATIVDAFCGAGGNAIQFAFVCDRVIAIDIDPEKLRLAKNNAEVYGVADRIEFIHGDFLDLAPSLEADVVFLAPPWGGPDYINRKVYDLNTVQGLEGTSKLLSLSRKITPNIAYYVPRNVNEQQLGALAEGGKLYVERNMFRRKVKCITAYYGFY